MSDTHFIGRTKELMELEYRYKSGRKEFGVIYGRRRIGKSEIIKHFLEGKKSLLFQAKRDNLYGNLKSFSYEVNKLLGQPSGFVFGSWEEALDSINELSKEHRFILAIDEYPYIVEQNNSFPSILQDFIDHANNNIFLLLSGSDVSMLRNEIENHTSPLYKRRTFEMEITQMPFCEALDFLTDFDNETKCNYLALFSTFPYCLSAIDHASSFDANMQRLLFNQYGTFFTLPDQLLSNSTKVQDVYNAILSAIAHRRRTNKEIADYIHEEEAKVSKYLLTLLDSELVAKRSTFMGNKKTLYYEINDPLLKFWYSFIFDNTEKIKTNGEKIFETNKDAIKIFISHGFEEVCRLYINQLNSDGLLSEVFEKPQVYRVEKSILGRSIELDGLSLSNNTLLVMECKYRESKFTRQMLEHLKESASVFPDKYKREYHLFSKNGFEPEVLAKEGKDIHCYDLRIMFGGKNRIPQS